MTEKIKLIVGLGNPGNEYQHTRHNAGWDFIQRITDAYGGQLTAQDKFFGLSARVSINHQDVRLLIPTTFMNLSGKSVAALAQFYKIAPEAILVVHDELDLAPGTARLKIGGGHGGHNGIKDIIKALGNNKDFARLRIGIDHPGNAKLVSNYVLKQAPNSEQTLIEESMHQALNVLPSAIEGKWNEAMKKLHTQ